MTFNLTEMQSTTVGEEALDLTKPKIQSADVRRPVLTPSMDALDKQTHSMLPSVNVPNPYSKCVSVISPNLPESATTEPTQLAQHHHHHHHHQLHPLHVATAAVPSQMRAFHPSFRSYDMKPPSDQHQVMTMFQQPRVMSPSVIHQIRTTSSKMPQDEIEMDPNRAVQFPKQEPSAEEENNNNNNDFNVTMNHGADSTVRTSPSVSCSSESDAMDFVSGSHEMTKTKRPFKMYSRDMMTGNLSLLDFGHEQEFSAYRTQVLEQMAQRIKTTNKNMRRSTSFSQEDKHSDPAYRERRRKNNAAAKRSRDARRAKEDEMAIRCEFLTRSNVKLKQDLAVALDRAERYRLELDRVNLILMSYQTKQM